MTEIELIYLRSRERQSNELAARTKDVLVRIAHQKMAANFAAQIALLEDEMRG